VEFLKKNNFFLIYVRNNSTDYSLYLIKIVEHWSKNRRGTWKITKKPL